MTSPGISVILPTLDCADDMPAHIRSMNTWLELAGEIIAVDSDSTDGTVNVIKENLNHPNLRIINHPRGLYQSWNHAISQTNGKWIYISTIGDTITRDQLVHLMDAGDSLNADVVSSPPEFIFDAKIKMEPPVWPIHQILEFHHIRQPTVIHPYAALYHALRSAPNAILGSSASNLYRGEHLLDRPFPTCFLMAGDTGWALRHALETRFCYTNRIGSVFRFHSDTYINVDHEANQRLSDSLKAEGMKTLHEHAEADQTGLLHLLVDLLRIEIEYKDDRERWGLARRSSPIPWYFRPAAIRARMDRNTQRSKLEEMTQLFQAKLEELPLLTEN